MRSKTNLDEPRLLAGDDDDINEIIIKSKKYYKDSSEMQKL